MRRNCFAAGVGLLLMLLSAGPATAIDWNLEGSLRDGGLDHYVAPQSNPLFNETPYITTELRPIFAFHDIDDSFLTGGGEVYVFALQARVALTDRLGIIATKDGYFRMDFDGVLNDDDGFANVALGLKYALVSNPEENRIVTVGVTYEPPSGNLITSGIRMQGTADGFLNMFASAAETWGKFGLEGNVGLNLAIDPDRNSSMIHLAVHADYEVMPGLFPLAEINMYSIVDDGNRTGVGFEGLDIVNFGSGPTGAPGTSAAGGGTVATMAFGGRYEIMDHLTIGSAYEFPISDRVDLFGWRLTTDLVIYY